MERIDLKMLEMEVNQLFSEKYEALLPSAALLPFTEKHEWGTKPLKYQIDFHSHSLDSPAAVVATCRLIADSCAMGAAEFAGPSGGRLAAPYVTLTETDKGLEAEVFFNVS